MRHRISVSLIIKSILLNDYFITSKDYGSRKENLQSILQVRINIDLGVRNSTQVEIQNFHQKQMRELFDECTVQGFENNQGLQEGRDIV